MSSLVFLLPKLKMKKAVVSNLQQYKNQLSRAKGAKTFTAILQDHHGPHQHDCLLLQDLCYYGLIRESWPRRFRVGKKTHTGGNCSSVRNPSSSKGMKGTGDCSDSSDRLIQCSKRNYILTFTMIFFPSSIFVFSVAEMAHNRASVVLIHHKRALRVNLALLYQLLLRLLKSKLRVKK